MLVLSFALLLTGAGAPAPSSTPSASTSASAVSAIAPLPKLERHLGRRPNDSGVFQQEPLQSRLQNLLGKHYQNFITNLGPATLQKSGAVFSVSYTYPGNKEGAVFLAWPEKDAITVFIFSRGTVQEFREKKDLMIPPPRGVILTMQKWFPQGAPPGPK